MQGSGTESTNLVTWFNTIIATVGLVVAIFALWQTRKSNRTANDANRISREANSISEKSMKMQEDEGRVRLVVKPQMLNVIGDGDDRRARPFVTIINLSKFPVTIDTILWKTNKQKGAYFYWKNPTLASPFNSLPVRLESRQALTAIGTPMSIPSLEDLLSVTSAVVRTECGEAVDGMTPQWQDYCATARRKGKLHWDYDELEKT